MKPPEKKTATEETIFLHSPVRIKSYLQFISHQLSTRASPMLYRKERHKH